MSPEEGTTNNWTTPKVFAVVALAGAVAAVGTVYFLAEGDDEERPPIIVNNGSIEFEPDSGLFGGEEGTWGGSARTWKHTHPKRRPSALQVKASPNDRVCTAPGINQATKTPFTSTTLTIKYGPALDGARTVVVSIDADGYLQLNFADEDPQPDTSKKLIAYAGTANVRVQQLLVGAYSCTFTRNTKLKIYQLR